MDLFRNGFSFKNIIIVTLKLQSKLLKYQNRKLLFMKLFYFTKYIITYAIKIKIKGKRNIFHTIFKLDVGIKEEVIISLQWKIRELQVRVPFPSPLSALMNPSLCGFAREPETARTPASMLLGRAERKKKWRTAACMKKIKKGERRNDEKNHGLSLRFQLRWW